MENTHTKKKKQLIYSSHIPIDFIDALKKTTESNELFSLAIRVSFIHANKLYASYGCDQINRIAGLEYVVLVFYFINSQLRSIYTGKMHPGYLWHANSMLYIINM